MATRAAVSLSGRRRSAAAGGLHPRARQRGAEGGDRALRGDRHPDRWRVRAIGRPCQGGLPDQRVAFRQQHFLGRLQRADPEVRDARLHGHGGRSAGAAAERPTRHAPLHARRRRQHSGSHLPRVRAAGLRAGPEVCRRRTGRSRLLVPDRRQRQADALCRHAEDEHGRARVQRSFTRGLEAVGLACKRLRGNPRLVEQPCDDDACGWCRRCSDRAASQPRPASVFS
jgi:hypothetical protein